MADKQIGGQAGTVGLSNGTIADTKVIPMQAVDAATDAERFSFADLKTYLTPFINQLIFNSQIKDDFMNIKIPISSAQILALTTSNSITLIAGQGAGTYIKIIACEFVADSGSPYTTASASVSVGSNTVVSASSGFSQPATSFYSYNVTSNFGTTPSTNIDNAPVLLKLSAAVSGGTQNYNVYLTYTVVTL